MTIPIHLFESIDSTSSEIQRKLQSGAKPPFAVLSREQSGGRGRRGRHWVSPEGNMYLSLTLQLSSSEDSDRGMIPIKVACLISEWLSEVFGLRVTIKWPNDICLGAKKLAGILCESSWNGNHWGPVIIGVGLNLKSMKACNDLSSGTVSLEDVLLKRPDPEVMAKSFLDYIERSWSRLSNQLVIKTYQKFCPGSAHCWVRKTDKNQRASETVFKQDVGLMPDGALCLEPLGDHSWAHREILHSASHHYEWFYQKNFEAPVLIAAPVQGQGHQGFDLYLYERVSDHLPVCSFRLSPESPEHEKAKTGAEIKQYTSKFETGRFWPVFCLTGVEMSPEVDSYKLCDDFELIFKPMTVRPVFSRVSPDLPPNLQPIDQIYLEGLLASEIIKPLKNTNSVVLYLGQNNLAQSYRAMVFRPDGELLWCGLGSMGDGWDTQKILENIKKISGLDCTDSSKCVEILTEEHNSSISEGFSNIAGKDIFLTGLRVIALGGH